MKNKLVWFFVVISFFILIILNLGDFIYIKNFAYSDIPITHFPNLLFIQNSLKNDFQIPLWSNLIFSGTPFSSNPLSGLWYLPNWLGLLFPLPLGINIVILLHLIFGVYGFYKFLKIEGRSSAAAIFGAVSFFAGTKVFSHIGAGHLSLICALAWTPWVLFFTKERFITVNNTKILQIGICFAMIICADPRWIIPSGLLWFLYFISNLDYQKRSNFKDILNLVKPYSLSIFIGLTLSTAVWLPLISAINLTSRSSLNIRDNLIYSFGIEKSIGMLFPDFGGFAEWVIYPTSIILLISVLSIFLVRENKVIRIWFYVFLFSFFLSLGENFFLNKFIFQLPLFDLLRVPSRFLFISLFSLSCVSAFGFGYLMQGRGYYRFDRLFFVTPIIAFTLILAIGVFVLTKNLSLNFVWGALFGILSFILIGLSIHKKIPGTVFSILALLLLFLDGSGVNYFSLDFKAPETILNQAQNLLDKLNISEPYRIYSPSYAVSQEIAVKNSLNMINGIDPMQLTNYVKYFSEASNIPITGYTVTLPPFEGEDPHSANQIYCPNIEYMEKLAVKYIISNYQYQNCVDFPNSIKIGDSYVYKLSPKWAWIENNLIELELSEDDFELINYSPNKIEFIVKEKGYLTVSEVYDRNWKVFINGKESKIVENGLFRSLNLLDNYNYIQMIYIPISTWIGFGVEGLGWIVLGLTWYLKKNKFH